LVPRSRKNLPVVSSISSWVEATAICDNSASCSFASGRCCRPISELADSPRECLDALAGAATALQNLNAITATIEIALRSLYRHKQIRCFETTVPPVFTAGRDSQGEIDRGFAPLFSFNRHRRSLHSEFGVAMSTTVQRDLPGNSEHSAPTPTNPPIPDDGFSPWSESQNNVASEWAREPTSTQSNSRGKLVDGVVMASALALGTAAYFFLSPAPEKTAGPTATEIPAPGSDPTAIPIPETQAAPQAIQAGAPEPSSTPQRDAPSAPPTFAWPDPPAVTPPAQRERPSEPVAPTSNTAALPPAGEPQNRDILFLQRPGVNIRSAPSATGRILGTAPQGTRFEVTSRERDWVQVESDRFKGCISGRFLGPDEPR
jgi:hypothetical protein